MSLEQRTSDTWKDAERSGALAYRRGEQPQSSPYLVTKDDPLHSAFVRGWYAEQMRDQQRRAGIGR